MGQHVGMSNTGILFFSLYGCTLCACIVTYLRVVRMGRPRGWKLACIGLILSALILTTHILSRQWEFGFAGDVIRVYCVDGTLGINVVNETVRQERPRGRGWPAIGWYRTENTVVRMFLYRHIPNVRSRPASFDSLDLPLSWMFFTVLIPSCIALLHYFQPPPSGHCSKCRYNLTGNESGVCPECGTKVESA
jgi:hypothetical protein